jgi:hypothetical protein
MDISQEYILSLLYKIKVIYIFSIYCGTYYIFLYSKKTIMLKTLRALAFALIIFLMGSFASKAQTTGQTNLQVILNPILSILVNQPTTTITFTTGAQYENGNSTDQAAHLTITNIGAQTYSVKVASSAATLAGTGTNTHTIPAGDINISVDGGAASVGAGSTANTVTLSSTATALITGGPASLLKSLGVTYAIPAASSVTLIGLPSDTYSTTVTYTISNP